MIKNLIFLDTSALYSLFIKNDSLFKYSREILKELRQEYKVTFMTTSWVKYETLSKLKKHGIDFCIKFEQLLEKLDVYIETISEEIENQALQIFWAYKDKSWGVIDCTSIIYMQQNSIYYVFGADQHFFQAGLFPLMHYDDDGDPQKSYSKLIFYT